ncbi:MAG TPA: PQQ-binding-like beta-propeller repeat protein [Pyrinomonadaceae bacterium]|nr:PQQ-binding-like beta-propeller repeat protein [Pyrinomonadaceae bacterium]
MRLFVRAAAFALLSLAFCPSARAQGSWEQWGGPSRNFAVEAKGLAAVWPEKGPRQLWKRELGEGYSAIVSDGPTLYTMYSRGDQEVVVALAADTGKTVWEHAYDAAAQGMNYEFGRGPHSTPLLASGRLFSVGSTAKMHALDAKTGKVLWSHDLWKEFGGTKLDRGYSCSPVAYKGTVIVFVGGRGQAVMAFDQKDGRVAWKRQDMEMSPNSPLIINVGGQDQLVAFMGAQVAGLDPSNGDLLWSYPHPTDFGLNISTPVWGDDGLLFISSGYSGGSRVLRLTRGKDGKTTPEELWFHRRLRVHHGNAVRLGDYVYGSSGDFGPAFVAAVDVKTGQMLWQDRSFSKANFVLADSRLIILDEDGNLALAAPGPAGLKVVSKFPLLEKTAWTVPTLVGTRLYVRDRRSIVAVDLS